jgi:hypothetical protein
MLKGLFNELSVGQVGRAARKLELLKILPLTDDTKNDLTNLYQAPNPLSAPVDWPHPDTVSIPRFNQDQVLDLILSKSKHTGGGDDGWRYKDLQDLISLSKVSRSFSPDQRESILPNITRLVQDIADGRPLQCPSVLERFRVVLAHPLAKRSGNKPRPIGVGCLFLQMAGTLLVRHEETKDELVEACGNTEFIFGVKGGSEAVAHGCRAYLALNRHQVGIKVDVSSAFQRVCEKDIAKFARDHPAFAGYCRIRCQGIRTARFRNKDGSIGHEVFYQGGFDQGDPLGTAGYPAIQAIAVNATLAKHPRVKLIGMADDKTIWGKCDDAFAAFETYKEELQKLGLSINHDKCAVYSQDGQESVAIHSVETGIPVVDGFMIGGAPVGSDAYMQRAVHEEAKSTRDLINLVSRCLNEGQITHRFASQAMTAVVRLVLCQKLQHLARSTPPTFTRLDLSLVDRDMLELTALIAKFRPPPGYWDTVEGDLAADRIRLRIRDGGLGISSLSQSINAMYVGSLALTLPTLFDRGFLVKDGALMNPQDDSENAIPDLPQALFNCKVNEIESLRDLTCTTIFYEVRSKVQNAITAHAQVNKANDIATKIPSKQDKAWFRSLCSPETGEFLRANWTRKGLGMDNVSWARALCLRVGWPTLAFEGRRICPHEASSEINNLGLHAHGCQAPRLRGARGFRHTRIKRTLHSFLTSINHKTNLVVVNEPNCTSLPVGWSLKEGFNGDAEKDRGDIFVYNPMDATDRVVLDLIVRTPATAQFKNAHEQPGVAAEAGYQQKIHDYNRRFIFPAQDFLPCAMEVTGRIHPAFLRWLRNTVRKASLADATLTYSFKFREILQKLSVALQSEAARATSILSELSVDYNSPVIPNNIVSWREAEEEEDMDDSQQMMMMD